MEKQLFAQEIRGHFNLRKRHSDRPTNIYFVLCIYGKQIKIPTGVRIYPQHWNRKKQTPLISSALTELDNQNNSIVLNTINAIKTNFQRYITYLCDNPTEVHRAKKLAIEFISPMANKKTTLSPLNIIKNGIRKNSTIKDSSKERHISRLKPFERFLSVKGIELDSFDKINRTLVLDYRGYLQNEYINPQGKKNTRGHINTLISELKTLLKGYAVPDYLSTAVVDDTFHKVLLPDPIDQRDNDIALHDDEIYMLYNYKAQSKKDERIKDMFIVNCLTGQRISDAEKIEPYTDPYSGAKRVMLYQKKTSAKVKFDIVFQLAYDILINKYDGKLPLQGNIENLISKNMPRIAQEAGIKGIELVAEMRGDETEPTILKKNRWELVKTHTERRTFITLLKLRGWDDNKVMKFSGHKDRAMIDHYCKLEPTDYTDFDNLKKKHPERVLQFTEAYREEPLPTVQAQVQTANDTGIVLDKYTAQLNESAQLREQLEYLKRTGETKEQWERRRIKEIQTAAKRSDMEDIEFWMSDPLKWVGMRVESGEPPEGEQSNEPTEEDLEKWAKMEIEWDEQHKRTK